MKEQPNGNHPAETHIIYPTNMLTREQIKANIDALEQQGAKPDEVQGWLNTLPKTQSPKPDVSVEQPGLYRQGMNWLQTPTFESKGKEYSPTIGGTAKEALGETARLVGNIPKSTASFFAGIPEFIKTVGKKLVTAPRDLVQAGVDVKKEIESGAYTSKDLAKQFLNPDVVQAPVKATYEAFVPEFLQKLFSGDTEGAQKSLVEHPGENIIPLILTAREAANLKGKGAEFDARLTELTKPITKPIERGVSAIKKAPAEGAKYAISKSVGIEPSTISEIVKTPSRFTEEKIASTTRESLGQKIYTAVSKRLQDLSSTGKEYEALRQTPQVVKINPIEITSVFDKFKVKLTTDKAGNYKVNITPESLPMSPTDISAIENFLNTYGKTTQFTPNAFLNARTALSNMSKYEAGKTNAPTILARELRATFDKFGKDQIKGLKELDAKYAPETKLMKKVKRDYLNKEGTLKDGALNKLANLTGKGRSIVLNRLEQIVPGVTKEIKILKSIEDIQAAKGNKVGAYYKLVGPGAAYLAGGLPAALFSMILSHPTTAVFLLRKWGTILGLSSKALLVITAKLRLGKELTLGEKGILKQALNKEIKLGLTIEDVSKNPLTQEAKKYKTADEFVGKIRGSATQYGDYTPHLRQYGMEDYKNISELGVAPDEMVTIYRGIDKTKGKIKKQINDGDFVTTDFDSAASYSGADNVVSMDVPAKTLYTDNIRDFTEKPFSTGSEYVYTKQKVAPLTKSQLIELWKKANK